MDATHIPALVTQSAYPVMFQAYEDIPGVRQLMADVRPVDAANMYGTKGTTIIGGSDLDERLDNEGFGQDRLEEGYTWQIKVRSYGKELPLDRRMVEAASSTEIENLITEWARSVGRNAAYQREQYVASQLQLATIAAGDTIFDGSFPGNADPNPLFIYDGQPGFSAAHPIAVGTGTFANFGVGRPLTSANLTAAKVEMQQTSAVDDRGKRIMNMAQTIIVPPSMEATARVLLNSQLLPGSANNDINIHAGTLGLVVNPFLTDASSAASWWLKGTSPGLRFYEQNGGPAFRTYENEKQNQIVVQLLDYWGGGFVDWRGLQCNNKATT